MNLYRRSLCQLRVFAFLMLDNCGSAAKHRSRPAGPCHTGPAGQRPRTVRGLAVPERDQSSPTSLLLQRGEFGRTESEFGKERAVLLGFAREVGLVFLFGVHACNSLVRDW